MVSVEHPAYKAGQSHAKIGWGREQAGCSLRQLGEGRVRVNELGPLLTFLLLSRTSNSLPPSWASRPSKVSDCCLVPDLGFHATQGQPIVTAFSTEKNERAHAFPLKPVMCHLSQEWLHVINLCCRGQSFHQRSQSITGKISGMSWQKGARHV